MIFKRYIIIQCHAIHQFKKNVLFIRKFKTESFNAKKYNSLNKFFLKYLNLCKNNKMKNELCL